MPRKNHVCPWYMAYTFDNPLRRLVHKVDIMLKPYVRPGMTVADTGCGMGYFSLDMARLVYPKGRVISVDLQQQMLDTLTARARRAGVEDIITPRLCTPDDLRLAEPLDFVLAFWMVHEVPDTEGYLRQVFSALRPKGRIFIAEPLVHVGGRRFDRTVTSAIATGFISKEKPRVFFSRAVVLEKPF